jgi:PAS domain S-box-containing protein
MNKAIIDSIPGTFYVLDQTGKFIRWNAYERDVIIGKPDSEISSMTGLETIHPHDRDMIQSKIVNVLQKGVDESAEARVLIKGGPDFKWFLLTGRQLILDGKPFLVGIGVDITESKNAADELQKAEARLTKSLDSLLEGCQILGFDYRFIYINNSAAMQGRRSKSEFLGHKIMDVLPGIEKTEMFAVMKVCMEERIPQHMENEFTYQDGSKGWFELSFQPIDEGIFILSIDITNRKNTEIALKEKLDEVEKLNQLMIGREMKMVELKSKNEELEKKKI